MSKVEVYLDQDQIKNLKSILSQSELGIHVLFDNTTIAEAFKEDLPEEEFFEAKNLKEVQEDLIKVLQFKTLRQKQDFIQSLDQEAKNRLIRAYFYIIENNLLTNKKLTH